jgi:hypothetical protein
VYQGLAGFRIFEFTASDAGRKVLMVQLNRQPLRPALVAAAVAAFATTGTMTASCSSSTTYVNCVDDDGNIVDSYYCNAYEDDCWTNSSFASVSPSANGNVTVYRRGCDSSHKRYWYYTSSRRYSVGTHAPSSWHSSRVDPADSSARTSAGLPSSGHVGGTKISSKGFGKSSSKSGSKSTSKSSGS